MTGPRLLVIDDEAVLRECLSRALPRWGYEVLSVSSAVEALAALRRESFDVVISDIKMPGINGLELLHQIKQEWPELDVILATGYVTSDTAKTAHLSGAYDYILKPYTLEHLTAVIDRALHDAASRHRTSPSAKAA